MLLSIVALLIGLALLVWSSDVFVDGAVEIAKKLGVSTLIIGITIIGFGTSAPEILISIFSVFDNTPDLAIGNAMGSNIANIGLVLGATALIIPLTFSSILAKREFPILLLATAVLIYALSDSQLSFIDGLLLLITLSAALIFLIKTNKDEDISNLENEDDDEISLQKALGLTAIGLVVLVVSSKMLVWGAVNIATYFGVSELIIGLTIVALGTSLPELAAAISGAKKGEPELVMGNIIGSNLFNSLAVVGLPAIMMDFSFSEMALTRDLPVMLGLTLLLFVFTKLPSQSACVITRTKGIVLFTGFVLYQCFLYYQVINITL